MDYASLDGRKIRYQSGNGKIIHLAYFYFCCSLNLLASHSVAGFITFEAYRAVKDCGKRAGKDIAVFSLAPSNSEVSFYAR